MISPAYRLNSPRRRRRGTNRVLGRVTRGKLTGTAINRFSKKVDRSRQSCKSSVAQTCLANPALFARRDRGEIMEKTLFDKYGGFSTISKIVLSLYDRLLEDDDVGPFFDDVDMPKLIDHQTKFVSSLMGGPASFTDNHIERAHRDMVIENHHFDRLKVMVAETLSDFDLNEDDIATVLDAFEQRRSILIEKPNVN